MKPTAIIALSALALACHVGPRADDIEVAHEPGGARASITAWGGTVFDGELLAVADTGLLVLRGRQVSYMPYAQTSTLTTPMITLTVATRPPSPADRKRLRLMSRFPQGLTPDLEARLLAALHQRAVVVLAP